MRCSPVVIVGQLRTLVLNFGRAQIDRHTVLGSRGLLIVTSVPMGRITMAAGARCMNVGLEIRVREVKSVRKRDMLFC
jgi:hypothetical protein